MGLIDALTNLLKLGVNLTDGHKAYLEWRQSDEGKAHFTQDQENEFYEALAEGDTSVIDVDIKETQDQIDKLRRRAGLAVVLIGLCFTVGCIHTSVPKEPVHAVSESLTAGERSYAVKDIEVRSPDGDKKLDGIWHIISADAMKVNRRNQQDLLIVLKLLERDGKYQRLFAIAALAAFLMAGVGMFFVGRRIGRIGHPLYQK